MINEYSPTRSNPSLSVNRTWYLRSAHCTLPKAQGYVVQIDDKSETMNFGTQCDNKIQKSFGCWVQPTGAKATSNMIGKLCVMCPIEKVSSQIPRSKYNRKVFDTREHAYIPCLWKTCCYSGVSRTTSQAFLCWHKLRPSSVVGTKKVCQRHFGGSEIVLAQIAVFVQLEVQILYFQQQFPVVFRQQRVNQKTTRAERATVERWLCLSHCNADSTKCLRTNQLTMTSILTVRLHIGE